ncbi:MAG: xanthine dehydrogenase family protein molybdopterin-binding subunit [Spirochaetaceae bacterium]|jgi:CO/xanthine dehydrogenase Mo-binding subunit|nr:xanthine dehydrogenase family protein molybdopterin-binding subunit [Spirochaetaceae bacterium]
MNQALFVDDIPVPGALFALTLRSPAAKGRLKEIRFPRLPSGYIPVRAEDIPGKNQLEELPVPILASESVSYIGEPVALLLGPNKAKLEEFAGLSQVEVEPEPPFFSAYSAPPELILARRDITLGDPGKAFEEAKAVVNGIYRTGIQEHWYSDSQGAVAEILRDESGKENFLIHTATQWPFHVKRSAAALLGLSPSRVEVEPARIGLHLDGKIWYPSLLACHAALGAYLTKRPVKIILTRDEDFRYTPKRCGSEIRIRSALGEKGQILATEIQVIADLGAQGVFTEEILDRMCLGALGTYKIPHIRIEGIAVKTNVPPGGPFAGFGLSQGFFAMERHVSHIADTLRQDPGEWRKAYFFNNIRKLTIGVPLKDTVPLEALLDTTAAMSDYHRKWASYELLRLHRRKHGDWRAEESFENEVFRGIGIATAYQGSGFLHGEYDLGSCSVELTLEKDGSLEIKTSMVSSNREHTLLWKNTAAEILAIETASVRVVTDNTRTSPDSGPAALSRNVMVITRLVERVCEAIRKQRFRDPLPITISRSYRPAKMNGWEGKPIDGNALARLGWGAAAVEVEIDPVEYIPNIRGIWLGIDGGRILSEAKARRSLFHSTLYALGWASREYLMYKEGRIPLEQIHRYGLPVPGEIPPVHIDFIRNNAASPKGIEELPFSCVPAAYVQAVSQAMDHPFEKIPLGALDIWEAEKLKKAEVPV